MPSEPLIEWPQPILEYLGFLAAFLSAGAIGFRYFVLPRLGAAGTAADPPERAARDLAAARAAALGLLGVLIGAGLLAFRLPELAARRHLGVLELLRASPPVAVQIALTVIALGGFTGALATRAAGWHAAAIGVVAGGLRAALFGQWERLVNPVHVLAGGLWIGTLFVLTVAGLPAVMGSGLPSDRRGGMVAAMVGGFSPLALGSAALLAMFGVITAWRHLHRLEALWTTPYGIALILKLCAVAAVVGVGAYNWRGLKPRLGGEGAALALRRSARRELLAAALVLAITAILVSLPSPKP